MGLCEATRPMVEVALLLAGKPVRHGSDQVASKPQPD
jgi:hypothetical protein